MTPHKHSPGGSFITDRQFKGIGRVHRASGITREATFNLFDDALTEMAKESAGRDWIRAYQRLEIEGLDLWGKIKTGKWRVGPSPATAKPLIKALEAWLEEYKPRISSGSYIGRKAMVDRFRRVARAGATVDELPAVLRAVKKQMMKHGPMGDMAAWCIEQEIETAALHEAGQCDNWCPYCAEEEEGRKKRKKRATAKRAKGER